MSVVTNVSYKILVYTGDERRAGTNANVFITLYGSKGQSSELELGKFGNDFEKGDTNEFTKRMANLGEITKIRIRHDNSGIAAGWYLDKIVVNNSDSAHLGPWEFPCYKWLEGDHNAQTLYAR